MRVDTKIPTLELSIRRAMWSIGLLFFNLKTHYFTAIVQMAVVRCSHMELSSVG